MGNQITDLNKIQLIQNKPIELALAKSEELERKRIIQNFKSAIFMAYFWMSALMNKPNPLLMGFLYNKKIYQLM